MSDKHIILFVLVLLLFSFYSYLYFFTGVSHQEVMKASVIETQEEIQYIEEVIEPKYTYSDNIFFTSYNPTFFQTDDSPCQGAIANVCDLYKYGERPIALSRDLLWGNTELGYCNSNCPFTYWDKVELKSDIQQCNFRAIIVDTMAKRFKKRGDIFFPDRNLNTSCWATIAR